MFTCKFCGRTSTKNGGNNLHQNRCKNNPDRVDHNWVGRKHTQETLKKLGKTNLKGLKTPSNILDVSKRTTFKIIKRLNLSCSLCGWDKGSCDIHHIVHRKDGGSNEHSNLTYICPNCHRLAHENKISSFVSLQEQIGDKWKEYYFAWNG